MICAYCGNEGDRTLEHIISHGVLDLFPECDYTYDRHGKVYQSEPAIKDVCSNCNNNRISYIDSYAIEFIKKYFIKVYDTDCEVLIEYDYCLLSKVLIKYAFNDTRASKKDTSFFNEEIKSYLLNREKTSITMPISIYGGIAVNTSVVPSFVFGNKKLYWVANPTFLENSMIEYYDEESGRVFLRKELNKYEIDGLLFSYLFKFNSGQFIIMFWENEDSKKKNEILIPINYPYSLIEPEKNNVIMKRCTHAYNFHTPELIDVSWGIPMADVTNSLVRTDIDAMKIQKELNKNWEKREIEVRTKFLVNKEKQKKKKKRKK